MKKIIIITGILTGAALSSSAQVEGNVTDASGKFIANAVIIAIDSAKNSADTIKSDKGGYFIYKKLTAGKYTITVKAAGYQHGIYENILVKTDIPDDDKSGKDISNAIWLDAILKPLGINK
ncbi:MAG: carboxypeptidase-like regulatory domain-containing protein [Chitinophagaceae bacterium]